jgi:hypothetical protein
MMRRGSGNDELLSSFTMYGILIAIVWLLCIQRNV